MLSSTLLQEKLNLHGKIGCILSIIGSTVIVLHAPDDEVIDSLNKIGRNICSIGRSREGKWRRVGLLGKLLSLWWKDQECFVKV